MRPRPSYPRRTRFAPSSAKLKRQFGLNGYIKNISAGSGSRNLEFLTRLSFAEVGFACRRLTDLASALGEDLLDFVVYRKPANFSLRKDDFAVDYDIELAGLAWLYLNFFTETGVE